jgi:oligoribonuclease
MTEFEYDLTAKRYTGSSLPTRLVWVDLEMTGLKPASDLIIEVGLIITDMKLNILEEFDTVINYPVEKLKSSWGEFWLRPEQKIERQKLEEESKDSKYNLADTEDKIIEIINKHYRADEAPILCGSSIRADRTFIDFQMPKLEKILHYRTLDVSSFKILVEGVLGKKSNKRAESDHRALSDIKNSIWGLGELVNDIKLEKAFTKLNRDI